MINPAAANAATSRRDAEQGDATGQEFLVFTLGDEEYGGDRSGRQTADRPERQRHPYADVKRRMAAHEDEAELVVARRTLDTGNRAAELAHARRLELRTA